MTFWSAETVKLSGIEMSSMLGVVHERMRRVTAELPISIDELHRLVPGRFRDFAKGVVDLRRGVLLLYADMQADQEAALLAEGSDQRDSGASTSIRTSTAPTGSSSTR